MINPDSPNDLEQNPEIIFGKLIISKTIVFEALGDPNIIALILITNPNHLANIRESLLEKFGNDEHAVDYLEILATLDTLKIKLNLKKLIINALINANKGKNINNVPVWKPRIEHTLNEPKASYDSGQSIKNIIDSFPPIPQPTNDTTIQPEYLNAMNIYGKLNTMEGQQVTLTLIGKYSYNGQKISVTGICTIAKNARGIEIKTNKHEKYFISRDFEYSSWIPEKIE